MTAARSYVEQLLYHGNSRERTLPTSVPFVPLPVCSVPSALPAEQQRATKRLASTATRALTVRPAFDNFNAAEFDAAQVDGVFEHEETTTPSDVSTGPPSDRADAVQDTAATSASSNSNAGAVDVVPLRRSLRTRTPNKRYSDDFVRSGNFHVASADSPSSLQEALSGRNAHEWRAAMTAEHTALLQNETWELVDRPPDKNVLSN